MTPQPSTPDGSDLFPFNALRASLVALVAIAAFPIVAGFVAAAAPRLAVLEHRSALALAANHLLTLGWGTLIAIGVLHQMLPAAAGVRRDLSPLIPTQLLVHLAGVILLAAGFMARSHAMLIGGGGLVTLSVGGLLIAAIGLLRHRRRTLPVLRFVGAALVFLTATAGWGWLLVINWRTVFSHALLGPMGLGVHIALGLIGWFGLLIVGVSYYLLPRFAGLKDHPPGHQGVVFAGMIAGVITLIAGAVASPMMSRVGLLVVGLAGFVYAADVVRLLRLWRPRAPDITRAHWWVLAVHTGILSACAVASALGLLPGAGVRWGIAGVALFLLGWVTLAITGQAYKVTPFLMWHYRFYRGLSAYEVPRLDAPYWPRAALPPFVLLGAAGPLVAVGALAGLPAVCAVGGWAFAAGAALFSFLLGYSWIPVIWRGRRPPSAAEPP
jgi:hypothetical protein